MNIRIAHLLLILAVTTPFWNCSEDASPLGGNSGTPPVSTEEAFSNADTSFQMLFPLSESGYIWTGVHQQQQVGCGSLIYFSDTAFTGDWMDDDTLELDSVKFILVRGTLDEENLPNSYGNLPDAAGDVISLNIFRVDMDSSGYTELKYDDVIDSDGALKFPVLEELQAELPVENREDDASSWVAPRDTLDMLLEIDSLFVGEQQDELAFTFFVQHDTSLHPDFLLGWYSAEWTSIEYKPRLEFYYSNTAKDTMLLKQLGAVASTYVIQDSYTPADDEFFVSAGTFWKYSLGFADLDLWYENGEPIEPHQYHSLSGETVVKADLRLFNKPVDWRMGGSAYPKLYLLNILEWESGGEVLSDSSLAVNSLVAGNEEYVDVDITSLISSWLDEGDYTGVTIAASPYSDLEMSPGRSVFYSPAAADATRRPRVIIYRTEAPFGN